MPRCRSTHLIRESVLDGIGTHVELAYVNGAPASIPEQSAHRRNRGVEFHLVGHRFDPAVLGLPALR